jgi:hypothetical protein
MGDAPADRSAPPTAPLKWFEIEAMLNIVIMANQLGPNANNIGIAAREALYAINQSLYPDGPPTFPTTQGDPQ